MPQNIIDILKKLRDERGLSQEYLASHIGVSRPTYVQIEKGDRELSLSEAQKLAALFGLTFEDFLAGKTESPYKVTLTKGGKKSLNTSQEIRISVPQNRVDKFKEVLLYVLEKIGARPHVGESVLYKILYFIDFDYYEKYEEQLMGATYIRNHYGPTPVEFAKIVNEMEKNNEIEKVETKYFKYPQTKYLPRREPELNLLNARETALIDDVIAKAGHMTAKEISEYSHRDVPWITAKEGQPIDYEAVLYRTPEFSVRSYDDNLQRNG